MADKVYSFLGLATKAGKLVSGDESCEKAIKAKKVFLVIVAEDASENTKKKFSNMCSFRGIHLRFYGRKELIGRYTGKELRSVIAISSKEFAERLIELIGHSDLQDGGV